MLRRWICLRNHCNTLKTVTWLLKQTIGQEKPTRLVKNGSLLLTVTVQCFKQIKLGGAVNIGSRGTV